MRETAMNQSHGRELLMDLKRRKSILECRASETQPPNMAARFELKKIIRFIAYVEASLAVAEKENDEP